MSQLRVPALEGCWQTAGYNKLFEIDGQRLRVSDLCAAGWVVHQDGPRRDFDDVFDRLELLPDGRAALFARGGITRYVLEHRTAHPGHGQAETHSEDPARNFEFFWRYFQENYAFFNLRSLDWDAVYQRRRPAAAAARSSAELQAILAEILVDLGDSHATLSIDGQVVFARRPHALVRHWQREFASGQFLELYPRGIPRLRQALNQALLGGQGRSDLNGLLLWGWLEPGIAYLAPFALFDVYASFDLLHFAGFEVGNLEFFAALERGMDAALADLDGARALVLDVRFNPGGHDAAGLLIAGRFADQRRLAFTKQAWKHPGLTAAQEIYVQPSTHRVLTCPLAVLVSPATASAAEVFLHALRVLPQARLLGEPSRGVLSDMLLMRLPNGWKVSLSNEVYTAAGGDCYEGRGVPPDLHLPAFDPDDFYASLPAAVALAVQELKSRSLP